MTPRRAAAAVRSVAPAPEVVPADRGGAVLALARRAREEALGWAATTTRLDLVILMTLLLVVVHTPGRPSGLVQLLCFAALLYRPLSRRPGFWFVLVGLWAALLLPVSWTTMDNHKWLLLYWALALGLSLRSSRPGQALAVNARLLLGLVFFFATAWKVLTPEFPSGAFFHFTLLSDERFTDLAEVVGGLAPGAAASNAATIDGWDDPTAPVTAQALVDGPRTAALGQVMAVGTIVVEGLVAATFLAPDRWRLSRAREASLLLFVLLTYPIAPVVGFGWLLVVMALAQSRWPRPAADLAYVAAFLAIFAFNGNDHVWSLLRRVVGGG